MKISEKMTYGDLEMSVIQDIQEWAFKKYEGTTAEQVYEKTMRDHIVEYWKEKLK